MGADKMINMEKMEGASISVEQLRAQMAEMSGVVSQFVTRVGMAIPVAIVDAGWHLGKSKGMLLGTEIAIGLSMLLSACGEAPNVNANPTSELPAPTEKIDINATATYAVGKTESSGLPLDVEGIQSIDPYDTAHVQIRANEIADFLKESVGPEVSKDMAFWEVYGNAGGAAGMLAHFSYNDAEWIMASYGPDGLGYLGTDADPIVAMQLVKNQAGFVSVVTPDGLRQIFQTDIFSDEVIAFLPFGEADWVERQNSPIGKFQAAPTEVPDGLIELLKNGGHYDFDQNGYVDSVGGLVYVVGTGGEVIKIPAELSVFKQSGGEIDMDKGIASDPETGRVLWLRARDGSWTEMKGGEAMFILTNGETLSFPIFDDIESTLEYSIFEVGMAWGDMLAWSQNSYTTVDNELVRKARMIKNKVDQDTDVGGTIRLSQTDSPERIAEIKVSEIILDDGTRLSKLGFRSSGDHNIHSIIIVDSSQNVLNALNNDTVYVPSPK